MNEDGVPKLNNKIVSPIMNEQCCTQNGVYAVGRREDIKFYTSRPWRRVRRLKLAMQPLCEVCLSIGLVVPASHVDHIVAIHDGGEPLDLDNLQSLCASCHSRKTASRDRGFGNKPGKERIPGCDPKTGKPLDPRHWWNER